MDSSIQDYRTLSGEHEHLVRLMKLKFLSFFSDFEITAMQAMTLEYILLKTGRGEDIYPGDLESFLFIRGSSVTSILKSLENDGYIQRLPLARDGRMRRLVPTEKAAGIAAEVTKRMDAYTLALFKGFLPDEIAAFENAVVKMICNLEQ